MCKGSVFMIGPESKLQIQVCYFVEFLTHFQVHYRFNTLECESSYKHVLEFLSHRLFNFDINNNSLICKFLKEVENAK